jgi:hypothetical protein
MSLPRDIHELNDRCNADPVRCELWVEAEWRFWKYVLRAIGKKKSVTAAIEAVGKLDGTRHYPTFTGTGNLPYDVHDRIQARLYSGLLHWLSSKGTEASGELAAAVCEYAEAVAQERAKGWFVVCSEPCPINVFAALAQAAIAKSSFEAHLRPALVQASGIAPGCAQRFRKALLMG